MQPVALTTLGRVALAAGDGRSLDAVLAQPKRLALLVYLAVAVPPGATVRRDTLLALFWPEADEARARNALRQSVHFLRRELGPDVLRARGTEELGVDSARLWCDAVALDIALAAPHTEPVGASNAFVDLWQGEFLPGFHLSGAPGWEQWVDGERARRHTAAVGVAWSAADHAAARGDVADAVAWGRRAAALEPESERALRRLIELCCRQGDVEAASSACATFIRRLAADGAQPSRRVREWCEALRTHVALAPDAMPLPVPAGEERASSTVGVAAAPAGTSSATSSGARAEPTLALIAPTDPGGAVGHAERAASDESTGSLIRGDPSPQGAPRVAPHAATHSPSKPKRSLRWRLTGPALALFALAGAWARTRSVAAAAAPSAAADAAVRVAVAPFDVRGSGEWAYLADGMADLLAAKLDGAGALRAVDVRRVLAAPALRPGGTDAAARAAAAGLGAHLCVLGSVVALPGGRVQLRAALYPAAADSAAPIAEGVVEGRTAELPLLTERLGADLLEGRLRGPAASFDRQAVRTTRSFDAMRAYLRGEVLFRAGHFAEAAAALREATAADTGFILAGYRLALAEEWAGVETWSSTAKAAARHAGRLSPHDRELLAGLVAFSDLRFADAERYFLAATTERPDDVAAWEQLAESRYHGGPQRGRPAELARGTWERVLALDSANPAALIHLARLAAHRGDRRGLDTLARRGLALEPDGERALELRALRAVLLDDAADRARALAGLRAANDIRVSVVAVRVAESSEDPARVRAFAELLVDPRRGADCRKGGYDLLGGLELARGHWAAAAAMFDKGDVEVPGGPLLLRDMATVLPFVPVTPAEIADARARVDAMRAAARAPAIDTAAGRLLYPARARARVVSPAGLTELAGELAARAGDAAGALALAAVLDTMASEPGPPGELYPAGTPPRALAAAVRAHAVWLAGATPAGDPDGLAAAARAWRGPGDEVQPYGAAGYAYPRFLHAELLRRAGRRTEALGWYASVWEDLDYGSAFAAPAHRAQAELLEQLGRPREAAEHWRRFVALWADADPPLQPEVARARRRLAALGGSLGG